MAEVKWIKIVTDIFDNRKIKLIRKMPEGDALVVTWFQLLCLAGETNDNGLIYVTKAIPYTDESLANAFDTPFAIIRLALDTFQRLEMIAILESFLCISNWEKYQNVDGLERIKEQNRLRKQRQRAKMLPDNSCPVTVTGQVTQCHATDIDKEVDIDKNTAAVKPPLTRSKYGEFGRVLLTSEEYQRLITDYGELRATHYIQYVDESAQSTGNKNKWKDWNLVVRKAIKNKWGGEPSFENSEARGRHYEIKIINGKEVAVEIE